MDNLYVKKVLNGDTEGFRYFIQNYKDLAFSVAISIEKDEFWAEEVVLEAFIKAFRKLNTFRGHSSFKTWFCRIVINEAFQRIREEKKHHTYTPNYQECSVDTVEDTLKGLSSEEQIFLVQKALTRISSKESLVLRLFYLEEQDTKTISNETGWSEANVRVILHRGRKNMLAIVEQLMLTEFQTT